MTEDEREKLFATAQADLMALQDSGALMPFEFRPHEAFFLLQVLQLALRDSRLNTTAPGQYARTLAQAIERRIARTPALAEMARAGWDTGDEMAAAPARATAHTSERAEKPAARGARGRK